jgi:transposase
MDLIPLHERVVALDIHQAVITACALLTEEDGVRVEERSFETFKRGLRALVDWCIAIEPEVVVMESTGVYWKSAHAWLERAGFKCIVVNARHVKNVPGRKSDFSDPRWLGTLARAGLLKPSFVPPEKLRCLRIVSRQRQKLVGMACAHKMLRVIWAMLLRKEPYRDATVDYEALSVRRNAPRWIRALKQFGYLRPSAATR